MTWCPHCSRFTETDVIPAVSHQGRTVPAFLICAACGNWLPDTGGDAA